MVQRASSSFFPYGTFVVNLAGCLVFGIIMGAARQRFVLGPSERAFLLIGILGGFTTFSAFGLDTLNLAQQGHHARATVYVLASVVGAIVGEFPAGIRDGLGGSLLQAMQYYSFSPADLWAAIVACALVGILAFGLVVLAERFVLRNYRPIEDLNA